MQTKAHKPKIAILIDAWFPLHGGGQYHVLKIAEELHKQDHEVTVLTRKIANTDSSKKKSTDTPAVSFLVKRFGLRSHFENPGMRIWFMIRSFIHLVLAGKKYELYHAHDISSAITIKAASLLTKIPTVITVHGTTLFKPETGLKELIEKIVLTRLRYSAQITVSNKFLTLPNRNKPVHSIPNGIDLEKFKPKKNHELSNTQFNSNKQYDQPNLLNTQLLFVGRIEEVKGLDILIQALEDMPNVTLNIVGEGSMDEEIKKQAIIRKVDVKFHGKLTGQDLVRRYQESDIFILPSRSEAFPLTLLEAAACGLPIVATKVGDNERIVKDRINGYAVPAEDPHALTIAIRKIANNSKVTHEMRANSPRIAAQFSWENCLKSLTQIYGKNRYDHPQKFASRLRSALTDKRMPWRLFGLLTERKKILELTEANSPQPENLLFSLTIDVEQKYGSASNKKDLTHLPAFFGQLRRWSQENSIPSTCFVQGNLIQEFKKSLHKLEEEGHELGVHGYHHELWGGQPWFLKDEWVPPIKRWELLKALRKEIIEEDFKTMQVFRVPNMVADAATLKMLPEFGFTLDSSGSSQLGTPPLPQFQEGIPGLPVSRDPAPQIKFFRGAPFGHYGVLNMHNFLNWPDEKILAAIQRLIIFQQENGWHPHIVFLAHSWDLINKFKHLDEKLSMLKSNLNPEPTQIEFLALSQLATKLQQQ
jgi:glycosyltransferase involved in cell wall biosynthesis